MHHRKPKRNRIVASSRKSKPILSEIVPILEKHREIKLSRELREKLLKVSSATIDRLLAEEKKTLSVSSRSHTKPGTLLKSQIPIGAFSEWDDARPGFVEIDLVAHDGGDAQGEYLYTLDLTDVRTAWTELNWNSTSGERHAFIALGVSR